MVESHHQLIGLSGEPRALGLGKAMPSVPSLTPSLQVCFAKHEEAALIAAAKGVASFMLYVY